jgi:hypothetical protein
MLKFTVFLWRCCEVGEGLNYADVGANSPKLFGGAPCGLQPSQRRGQPPDTVFLRFKQKGG